MQNLIELPHVSEDCCQCEECQINDVMEAAAKLNRKRIMSVKTENEFNERSEEQNA